MGDGGELPERPGRLGQLLHGHRRDLSVSIYFFTARVGVRIPPRVYILT